MKYLVILLGLLSCSVNAETVSQFICSIGGIYTNNSGKIEHRSSLKGIGELLYVDMKSGEVTGYFRTDGWHITKFKRPKGILTIETASGFASDSANRLRISPTENQEIYNFEYTKNLLNISGTCKAKN